MSPNVFILRLLVLWGPDVEVMYEDHSIFLQKKKGKKKAIRIVPVLEMQKGNGINKI